MIIIEKFWIGNKFESFFLPNLTKNLNIIFSDENNKGKTIVTQGIMYSLGNTPIFPKGFDNYNDYYFITEIKVNDNIIKVCRKRDTFFVNDGCVHIFNMVKDFEVYFNERICHLTNIKKDNLEQRIGLDLFYEMFFLPQDKRTTSNIFCYGRYNKKDFINAIHAYCNVEEEDSDTLLKNQLTRLTKCEDENKIVLDKLSRLNNINNAVQFASYSASKENIDNKLKKIEDTKNVIIKLSTVRNRLFNKKTKNEILLKEISSLNKELKEGKLICLNCGSDCIGYELPSSNVRFDITDNQTREEIFDLIKSRIYESNSQLSKIQDTINVYQIQLVELMKDEDVNLENLVFYKNEVLNRKELDSKNLILEKEISNLKLIIKEEKNKNLQKEIEKKEIDDRFIKEMNYFYNYAEPKDILKINDYFTKNSINYSGSQGSLFLMSRLYGCSKILPFNFPIIIDDFRNGEISTFKEEKIIDAFKKLNVQVILTCTLKKEEVNKYNKFVNINQISFNDITEFQLLNKSNNSNFQNELKEFSINLELQ